MSQFKRYNGNGNRNYQSGQPSQMPYKQFQQRAKKRSGAKFVSDGKGLNTNISAWNYSKEKGLVSVLVFPTKYSDQPSKSGGLKLCAKVNFKRTGQTTLMSAVQSSKNDKIYIAALGWVINPKAPNGGYCGQSKRP